MNGVLSCLISAFLLPAPAPQDMGDAPGGPMMRAGDCIPQNEYITDEECLRGELWLITKQKYCCEDSLTGATYYDWRPINGGVNTGKPCISDDSLQMLMEGEPDWVLSSDPVASDTFRLLAVRRYDSLLWMQDSGPVPDPGGVAGRVRLIGDILYAVANTMPDPRDPLQKAIVWSEIQRLTWNEEGGTYVPVPEHGIAKVTHPHIRVLRPTGRTSVAVFDGRPIRIKEISVQIAVLVDFRQREAGPEE